MGELWTDMAYDGHGLCYNQDPHRQQIVDWVNGTGKKSTAFDFTTKGILQEACRLTQFWRPAFEGLGWLWRRYLTPVSEREYRVFVQFASGKKV